MDFDPTEFDNDNGVNLANDFEAFEYNTEEDEEKTLHKKASKTATLFAIHAMPSMFSLETNPETGLQFCLWSETLSSIAEVMKSKIVANEQDISAILLFNTANSKNPLNFNGIYVIQDFEQTTAARIKDIINLSKIDLNAFKEEYGFSSPNDFNLSDFFWTASQIFSMGAPKATFKSQMYIFTTEDTPCTAEQRQFAINRASDLQNFAQVDLFPLDPPHSALATSAFSSLSSSSVLPSRVPGSPFNIRSFYKDCLKLVGDGANEMTQEEEDDLLKEYLASAACSLTSLRKKIRQKQHAQRKLGSLFFFLTPEIKVSINIYTSILQMSKPTAIKVSKKDRVPLRNETVFKTVTTDKELSAATDIQTFFPFGDGELVPFTQQERSIINNFGSPSLTLIGFKPAPLLPFCLTCGHSLVFTPDDQVIKGSSTFLAALSNSLFKKGQIGIARLIARSNSAPRFVALYPYRSLPDTVHSGKITGFSLVPIPFSDDVRELKFPSAEMAPAADQTEHEIRLDVLKKMKNVLKGLRVSNFKPYEIENPVLQKFYNGLEVLALGTASSTDGNGSELKEESEAKTDDGLQPDEESMSNIKPFVDDLLAMVDPHNEVLSGGSKSKTSAAKKRSAPCADGIEEEGQQKRRKTADLAAADVSALAKEGKLSSLNVEQLKAFLKEKGLPVSGKKAELVTRLEAAFA